MSAHRKEFEEIEPKEVFTILEKHRDDPDFVVMDVRTPEEYDEGHIENAYLLNFKSGSFEDELENMDKNKKYYVYCRTGRKSRKAVELMEKRGYSEAHSVIGGIDKWKRSRLPVEK
ncbi:rhodanese-like domain-containing protein [Methanobacterium sp. MBAC-LM]|uniref:rhodanese-like domain-containing protein n=1 Tax=Methanobacterium sp. MBAC-LM TaxID=3412034 RepID=UPI003C779F3E